MHERILVIESYSYLSFIFRSFFKIDYVLQQLSKNKIYKYLKKISNCCISEGKGGFKNQNLQD